MISLDLKISLSYSSSSPFSTCSSAALLFFASHLEHSLSSALAASERGPKQFTLMSRLGLVHCVHAARVAHYKSGC